METLEKIIDAVGIAALGVALVYYAVRLSLCMFPIYAM